MRRPHHLLAVLASPMVLAACGAGEAATIVPDAPVAELPTSTAPRATAPPTTMPPSPEPTAPPISAMPTPSSSTTVSGDTELMELAVIDRPAAAGDCPHGRWTIEPGELSLVQMLANGDLEAEGSIAVEFDDGSYRIAADDFELEVMAGGTTIEIDVDGSTTGSYTVDDAGLTLASSNFEMEAGMVIDGEPAASTFIIEMFEATFGSATLPYECRADGTLVVTYPTPTGPMVAVHRPA